MDMQLEKESTLQIINNLTQVVYISKDSLQYGNLKDNDL